MKTRYKVMVILLCLCVLNLMVPTRATVEKTGSRTLLPDNFTKNYEEWERIGADYQIDSNDNDTSYVRFNYTLEQQVKTLGHFPFEDILPPHPPTTYRFNVTSILNVTTYYWRRAETPGENFRVEMYWWNGSTFLLQGAWATSLATWTLGSSNLSSVLDTPEKVDNVMLMLRNWGAPSYDNPGRISYVWLYVWFTYTEEYIYPLRLILGLVGLILMIISPSIGVREVLKSRNLSMIAGCIISFSIGYALVHVWLIP